MHAVETTRDPNESLWLVDGLIHKSITTLASPPKAGKSALIVKVMAALSNGTDKILDRAINIDGPCRSIVFTTDADSRWEYTRRLRAHDANPDMISFIDGRFLMDSTSVEWDLNVKSLVHAYPNLRLVVLDNLLGIMGESAPGKELNRFWLQLQDFNLYDGAVVVLNHTAVQDETGRGMGRRPQGGRHNETSARQIVMMLGVGATAPSNVLKVVCTGNDMRSNRQEFYVELTDRNGEPEVVLSDWRPAAPKPRANRNHETRAKTETIKRLIATYDGPGVSERQLCQRIAAEHPELKMSASTIRTKVRAIKGT